MLASLSTPTQIRFGRAPGRQCMFSLVVVLALACSPLFRASLSAQAGQLDPTFGDGGKVSTNLGDESFPYNGAVAAALQPDGKVVAAGYMYNPSSGGLAALLARYNPDGSLDPGFGNGGTITEIYFFTYMGQPQAATFHAVALQPDGKIVAGGRTSIPFVGYDTVIARYNTDGTPDTSFGTDGLGFRVVLTGTAESPAGDGTIYGLAITPDGTIVGVGDGNSPSRVLDAVVIQVTSDGLGAQEINLGLGIPDQGVYARATSVTIQPDGNIVAVGYFSPGSYDAFLVRLNPDGTFDSSFGTAGKVVVDLSIDHSHVSPLNTVTLQPDGQIVVGGYTTNVHWLVARFNGDGTLDTSFGNNGSVVFSQVFYQVRSVVVQPDGKLIAGGDWGGFALVRLNADGTVDPSFGNNGWVQETFDYGMSCALLLQPDGMIVAVGTVGGTVIEGGGAGIGIMRLLGDSQ